MYSYKERVSISAYPGAKDRAQRLRQKSPTAASRNMSAAAILREALAIGLCFMEEELEDGQDPLENVFATSTNLVRENAHLLGTMTDKEVGSRLGVSSALVQAVRQDLGIPSYSQQHRVDLELMERLLREGRLRGKEIADQCQCAEGYVSRVRRKLGLRKKGMGPHGAKFPDDKAHLLGTATDKVIAKQLGLSVTCIQQNRVKRNIAPYRKWQRKAPEEP